MLNNSRLLALPAELKDEIYRFSLVQGDIRISSTGPAPKEPGLLSVCREIRCDALQIYYQENDFCFDIAGFDATRHINFCKTDGRKELNKKGSLFTIDEEPGSWPNLKKWLQAFYYGQCAGPSPYPHNTAGIPPSREVAARMFKIVFALATLPEKPSWEVVAEMVEDMRRMSELTQEDGAEIWEKLDEENQNP